MEDNTAKESISDRIIRLTFKNRDLQTKLQEANEDIKDFVKGLEEKDKLIAKWMGELQEVERKRDVFKEARDLYFSDWETAENKLSQYRDMAEAVKAVQRVLEQPIDRMDVLGVRKVAEMINSIPIPTEGVDNG